MAIRSYGVAVGETPPGVRVAPAVGVPARLGVMVTVAVADGVGEVPGVPVTAPVGVVPEVGEATVLPAGVVDAMADVVLVAPVAGVDAVVVETEGTGVLDPHAGTATTARPSEPASTRRRNEDRRSGCRME